MKRNHPSCSHLPFVLCCCAVVLLCCCAVVLLCCWCVGDWVPAGQTTPSSIQLSSLSVGDTFACGVTLTGSPTCFSTPSLSTTNFAPPLGLYLAPNTHTQLPFTAIWCGSSHACGIVPRPDNASVVCWTNSTYGWYAGVRGQFITIAGDCALDTNRYLYCWGDNGPPPATTNVLQCDALSGSDSLTCCLLAGTGGSSGIPGVVYYWLRGFSTQWALLDPPAHWNISVMAVWHQNVYVVMQGNPIASVPQHLMFHAHMRMPVRVLTRCMCCCRAVALTVCIALDRGRGFISLIPLRIRFFRSHRHGEKMRRQ